MSLMPMGGRRLLPVAEEERLRGAVQSMVKRGGRRVPARWLVPPVVGLLAWCEIGQTQDGLAESPGSMVEPVPAVLALVSAGSARLVGSNWL